MPIPADRLRSRAWRGLADMRRVAARQGSARPALDSFGRPSRRDLTAWIRQTSELHERYRSEHAPVTRRAAVVCVSMRPDFVGDVVASIVGQRPGLDLDVVFVANHPGFAEIDLERFFAAAGGATIIEPPTDTSLGAALNLGFDATDERFVAKLDDDDWYGPGYLLDGLRAHRYAGAGVVGKHSYYAHVEATDGHYLRFPGHEFRYSATLAGGTLLVDRDRTSDLQFEDVSLGEDRRFLAACHRRGVSTFSADRFGFVQRRGAHNTWTVALDDFLRRCLAVDPADSEHQVARPDLATLEDGS